MTDLVVESIHKTLGPVHVLKGASFSASKGMIVALLGASGSGKTTLLRCLAGLEVPESGRIAIGGRPMFDGKTRIAVPPEKRNIGLVFQSYALWPHKTVAENVAFGLKLRGVSGAEAGRRVSATLEKLGLGHLGERYPFQLSGGQQQRVAICRALIYEPSVILLDEPLSNLDAKLREEARFWIRKLILDLKLCAVVVTHDQGEALAMSDRILLLKDGRIVQEGSPVDIYASPSNRYTAEFLGMNNVVMGIARNASGQTWSLEGEGWSLAGTAIGQPEPRQGEKAVAIVRIERIRAHNQPGPGRMEMKVDGSVYLGDRWEYRLVRGGLALRAHGEEPIGAASVWCEIKPEHVWIFGDDGAIAA
jgi:iron(III) transport system ATP-binding protein